MHVGATQGDVMSRNKASPLPSEGAAPQQSPYLYGRSVLNVLTVLCMMCAMGSPYDCQREAQTAMSMALAATGNDRQNWVRVALSWQYLARNAADRGRACGSGQERPLELPA